MQETWFSFLPVWFGSPNLFVSLTLQRTLLEMRHCNLTDAAAAAALLQSCPTLWDPIDGSPQAPPSLGFSRQEHWSGLPFPSPMHESEKWKWSRSVAGWTLLKFFFFLKWFQTSGEVRRRAKNSRIILAQICVNSSPHLFYISIYNLKYQTIPKIWSLFLCIYGKHIFNWE